MQSVKILIKELPWKSFSFSFGAFIKTYLEFLPFKTDSILNRNLFKIVCFSFVSFGETANTASDSNNTATSFKLFLNKVLPLDTISQIPSASPIFGAISTEPFMTWISVSIPLSITYFLTVFG